jgi:flagellum-specific peptidoglycan hydrolase FlgJ
MAKLSQKDFINTFRPYVLPIAAKYNVPASVLLAQIALESGWLGSSFSQKYKNLTGMKAMGNPINGIWDGTKSVQATKEDFDGDGKQEAWKSAFRVYKNYTQSIEDLAHRHAIRFKFNLNSVGNDINNFIDKVVSTGYATGTGYYNGLNEVIDKYKLYDLDKGAKFIKKTKAAPKAQTTKPTTTATTTGGAKKK